MKFKAPNHVYKCVPPVLGNEAEETPVVIRMRRISVTEQDKATIEQMLIRQEFDASKAAEMITDHTMKLLEDHFDGVENLNVGDNPVIDNFGAFYSEAPPEFVRWYMMAVYSTQILTDAELKNS